MRARMALNLAEVPFTLHEVSLKDKPAKMLEISPKGTVPVLQLADGLVIEESLEIALWAFDQQDPQHYLQDNEGLKNALELIEKNDGEFKHWLDRYKYADRHLEFSPEYYRDKGEEFLQQLEHRLQQSRFLMGEQPCIADMAIMPFVRQFAHVDREWFYATPYPRLQLWLFQWLESDLFKKIMAKPPKN